MQLSPQSYAERHGVARADYLHTYGGWLPVWLVPYSTARRGQRCILYRWQNATGEVIGGYRSGHSMRYMVESAKYRPRQFRLVSEESI